MGIRSKDWPQIQNFIVMISKPLHYHSCLVSQCSVILEQARIITKLLLDRWKKLFLQDVLTPSVIVGTTQNSWQRSRFFTGQLIFQTVRRRSLQKKLTLLQSSAVQSLISAEFQSVPDVFYERSGFFCALLDTRLLFKSIGLTVCADALASRGEGPGTCWTLRDVLKPSSLQWSLSL